MKYIPRDAQEKLVLNILSELSKNEDKIFSEESLKLINEEQDNAVFTSIILSKANPSLLDSDEIALQESLITIVNTFFQTAHENGFDLVSDGFDKDFVDVFKKCHLDSNGFYENTQIRFALMNFALAFTTYSEMQKKYPNVMKWM